MDNIHLIQLNSYERPTITEEKNQQWVSIGDNNDYYQCLIDAFMDSTTNNAVINGVVNQIYGKGLDATDSSKKPEQYAQMRSLLKAKDLRRVCQDLKLLGEGSFQVTYKGNQIASITHFPRETLRAEKCGEDGEIKNYLYSSDWSKVNKSTVLKKFPVFGSGAKNEIYIIRRYVTGYFYYSPADYQTSYATLEKEIADYLINDAQSSFSGTKIVNFNNGVPDREKQDQIKNQVLSKLTGSYGEKVIIAFNNNQESKTTIDDVPLNDAPAHYEYLSSECQKKIMLTHRVTSPLLLGLRDGNGGLGSNADEIKNASLLFNNVVIKPYQDLIIDALDELFAVNNISLNLYFTTIEPLEFMEIDDDLDAETVEEETGIKQEDEATIIDEYRSQLNSDNKKCCFSETQGKDYEVAQALIELGEDVDSELWEAIDEIDVDYENESFYDDIITDLNAKELKLSKKTNLVSTGKAIPNAKSKQDKEINDYYFKVRYYYYPKSNAGGKTNSSRAFCQAMVQANKLYRKEDIVRMEQNVVNEGWGPRGTNNYSIWKYKGGGNCHHSWRRVTFRSKQAKINTKTSKDIIGTRAAEVKGYKVKNDYQVSVQPRNLPNKGFLPENPQGK